MTGIHASHQAYLLPLPPHFDKVDLGIDLLHTQPVQESEGGVRKHPVHHFPQLRKQGDGSIDCMERGGGGEEIVCRQL